MHPVGQQRAISLCALLALTAAPTLAAPPPTTQPARQTRLDLLYLHARLLTSGPDLPDAARPILAEAAKQKTWTASRTPVALLNPEQVQALIVAFESVPATTNVPALPAMLTPNRRVTAAPRQAAYGASPAAAASQFELTTTAGTLDAQGAVPLKFHAAATATLPPAPPARPNPLTATWSADLGVAAPAEQTLLVDLGAPKTDPSTDRPPRAFLLIRPSAQPVERKDAAATLQVAGDLYRSWDRVWPLLTELSAAVHLRQFADARRQAEQLREQLRPSLDAAEGTDFAKPAAAMADDLDAAATALRRFDGTKATAAVQRLQSAGNALHTTLGRLLADTGRMPTAPVTRPNSR